MAEKLRASLGFWQVWFIFFADMEFNSRFAKLVFGAERVRFVDIVVSRQQ